MKREYWLLLLILVCGAMLRFYGFPHIPFMYDELSAWARTGFGSFRELIDKGVRVDGHPALIQVFLNYWREIVGDSEAVFKLPFLLMGLASIVLVFLIGKLWFNETCGILSAALIAVLQYTVMYSQIARPYSSGLFFSLAMVWCWSKYIFFQEGRRNRIYLGGFILFAVLCCYNHYFSLLFAFIVGVSGFLFLEKERKMEYLLTGVTVTLLFAPHLSITRDQLSIGGVGGWLSSPGQNFFLNYLDYIFHFSWLLKGLISLFFVTGFLLINRNWREQNKFRLLCLAWFLLPVIIGFIYSKFQNPVLQFSVLIFSFPFFILFLFSFYREIKVLPLALFVLILLTAGSFSLISERKHFEIFYHQPIEEMVKSSVQFVNEHQNKKSLVLINLPVNKRGFDLRMNYYLERSNSRIPINSWYDLNFASYADTKRFIESQSADYILCGNVPYDHLQVIKEYFPKLIKSEKGFTRDYFCYAKADAPENHINLISFSDSIVFSSPGRSWNALQKHVRADSSGRDYFQLDSSIEFSCSYYRSIREIIKHFDDWLLIDVAVDGVPPDCQASLVVNFGSEQEPFLWQEKPFSLFIDTNETSGHLVYAMRFRDFPFIKEKKPPLSFYVWNKNKESFRIRSMKISVEEGNPWIYSLFEKIPSYADEYR